MTARIAILLFIALIAASCGGASNHTHTGFEIPEGEAVPTVELTATEDPVSGWNLQLVTTDFSFAPQRAGREVVLGEGHAHLYVDGDKRDRLYGSWYHLADLLPGRHTIGVTLNSNDHSVYQTRGRNIEDTVTIEVADRDHPHSPEPSVEADADMTVAVRLEEDSLSGWNLFVDTSGFLWAPEQVGLATTDGEGHAHLHVDGKKVGRIYGPAAYLGPLDPGRHTVTVSLHANNHAAYVIDGQPVEASVPVEVAGEPNSPDHTVEIVVRDQKTEGGVRRLDVAQGELVEITITTDAADSVHVHGYDLTAAVEPNQRAIVAFTATIRGVFEVELEQSGLLLAEIAVR